MLVTVSFLGIQRLIAETDRRRSAPVYKVCYKTENPVGLSMNFGGRY